jgi:serine/threonine protein kinase
MAPEVIHQSEGYDQKADVWSFGILILELVYGKPPHHNIDAKKTLLRVLNSEAPGLNKYQEWSPDFRSLVEDCL